MATPTADANHNGSKTVSPCTVFWFLCTLVLSISYPVVAYTSTTLADTQVGTEVDLTGYGMCGHDTISMSVGWTWTQYPEPLQIVSTYKVPVDFTGKNAIVWANNTMYGFVIGNISDTMIGVTDVRTEANIRLTELPFIGSCHFTLDATNVDYPDLRNLCTRLNSSWDKCEWNAYNICGGYIQTAPCPGSPCYYDVQLVKGYCSRNNPTTLPGFLYRTVGYDSLYQLNTQSLEEIELATAQPDNRYEYYEEFGATNF